MIYMPSLGMSVGTYRKSLKNKKTDESAILGRFLGLIIVHKGAKQLRPSPGAAVRVHP
jgi:hypothetical protein